MKARLIKSMANLAKDDDKLEKDQEAKAGNEDVH